MNKQQEAVLKVKKFAMINFLKSGFIEMLNKNDLIYLKWKKEIIAFSWYDLDIYFLILMNHSYEKNCSQSAFNYELV